MQAATESSLMASVIIPVYNKANYLRDCINSIEGQTIDRAAFEVILVDDGSSDNSLSICRDLANSSDLRIVVVAKENGGVSSARNAGMAKAQGKYLFFLDSDDSLSPCTLQLVVDTFEELGDSCDVVTYPLRYYYPETGKTRGHKRQQWFEESGLYPLEDYPFLAQSTMNVCIRNRFAENIAFSLSLKMGEDQLFVSQNLQRKAALGYCSGAQYTYTRDGANSSSMGNRPCNAFDDMILLYEELLDMAEETPAMAEYARQLVLYNFDWRLRASMLFPDFCEGKALEVEEARLASVFGRIPSSSVADSPYLGEFHKVFLLNRYGRLSDTPLSWNERGLCLGLSDGSLFECAPVRMVVSRCRRTKSDFLVLSGRLLSTAFLFEGVPELRVGSRGSWREFALLPSSYDYAGTRLRIAKCWSFEIELPLSSSARERFEIEIVHEGGRRETPEFELNLAFHDVRKVKEALIANGRCLQFADGAVTIGSPSISVRASVAAYTATHPKVYPSRLALRRFVRQCEGKRIWLYQDLPSSPVKNDALRQFLHDVDKKDEVERYFITEHVNELSASYPSIAANVVRVRSSRHKLLFAASELVIASYLERNSFVPFTKRGVNQLGDLFRPKKYVYLQHGVLHAHIPWYFSKDRILFDYEVVSTDFEVKNLTQNYCFNGSSLITSGAARFDDLRFSSADFSGKRIVYAPSWRSYLVGGKSEARVGDDDSFLHSRLWEGMKAFLDGVSESGILEKYDYALDIKLHPNFACYKHLFERYDGRIRLAEDNIDESAYAVMVTDFSSMVYDFVYTGARVMYFVPDHAEFRNGFNHYSKLDLPFEDGFGPYCETSEEACESLEATLRSLAMGDSDPYAARRRGFFLHEDENNRQRLYEALSSITA